MDIDNGENMSDDLVKITQTELESFKQRKNAIDRINQKMMILREKQIYQSLSEGTKLRINMLRKVQDWMAMLEQRIFNPKTIEEIDLKQVISLLKYTGSIALKLLSQTTDIEKLFKTYIDSSLATKTAEDSTNISLNSKPIEDEKVMALKKSLMEALTNSIKSGADDAILAENNKDGIEVEKANKLERLDDMLDDLPNLESEIKTGLNKNNPENPEI